jgi:hypothetical protein
MGDLSTRCFEGFEACGASVTQEADLPAAKAKVLGKAGVGGK